MTASRHNSITRKDISTSHLDSITHPLSRTTDLLFDTSMPPASAHLPPARIARAPSRITAPTGMVSFSSDVPYEFNRPDIPGIRLQPCSSADERDAQTVPRLSLWVEELT